MNSSEKLNLNPEEIIPINEDEKGIEGETQKEEFGNILSAEEVENYKKNLLELIEKNKLKNMKPAEPLKKEGSVEKQSKMDKVRNFLGI